MISRSAWVPSRGALIAALIAVLLAASALFLWLSPKTTAALDARAAACGPLLVGQIREQFALTHASDYRQRFPKMGFSPELENEQAAFMVVYEGPVTIEVAGRPNSGESLVKKAYNGVICVVVDGDPTVYVNVDTSV